MRIQFLLLLACLCAVTSAGSGKPESTQKKKDSAAGSAGTTQKCPAHDSACHDEASAKVDTKSASSSESASRTDAEMVREKRAQQLYSVASLLTPVCCCTECSRRAEKAAARGAQRRDPRGVCLRSGHKHRYNSVSNPRWQASKLLQVHQKKLRLLERKRRLLFPSDVLPDPPPHDDFDPVSVRQGDPFSLLSCARA